MLQDSNTYSVELKDSNDNMQSSSSQDQSESLSSTSEKNYNSRQTSAVVVSNKKKQDELKITLSPMIMRNDIENVDDLSDLEEFYLTEIE